MRAVTAWQFLAFVALSCHPATPVPVQDAGLCPGVCEHYQALGCPAGKPASGGATCATVCQNALASGLVRWNLACRLAAPSCDAAERCER